MAVRISEQVTVSSQGLTDYPQLGWVLQPGPPSGSSKFQQKNGLSFDTLESLKKRPQGTKHIPKVLQKAPPEDPQRDFCMNMISNENCSSYNIVVTYSLPEHVMFFDAIHEHLIL